MTDPIHQRAILPELHLPDELAHSIGSIEKAEYLGHGSTNCHWRLTTSKGYFIWRQFGPTPPGANRYHERQVLRQLQHLSWVPKLIFDCPDGVLFEAIESLSTTPDQLSIPQRKEMLEAIICLWQQTIPLETMDYPELISHYATLAPAFSHTQVKWLIQQAEQWDSHDFCLIHQDIHAGNLVFSKDSFLLIDWEYVVLGNPWIDAIALDRMLNLSASEKSLLACHLPDLNMTSPWQTMHQWLETLDQLWYAAHQGQAVLK